MKSIVVFLTGILLVASQADAACTTDDDKNSSMYLTSYVCEGGTIEDLKSISKNVTIIEIFRIPVGRITDNMFSDFAALKKLTCMNCQITDITDNAFNSLTKLRQLYLMDNKLRRVKNTWFKNTVDLRELVFSENNITDIDENAFKNLRNLELLSLSSNQLTNVMELEKWFGGDAGQLQYLYLEENKIRDIKDGTFSRFENIDAIYLRRNNLTELKRECFGNTVPLLPFLGEGNKLNSLDEEVYNKIFQY